MPPASCEATIARLPDRRQASDSYLPVQTPRGLEKPVLRPPARQCARVPQATRLGNPLPAATESNRLPDLLRRASVSRAVQRLAKHRRPPARHPSAFLRTKQGQQSGQQSGPRRYRCAPAICCARPARSAVCPSSAKPSCRSRVRSSPASCQSTDQLRFPDGYATSLGNILGMPSPLGKRQCIVVLGRNGARCLELIDIVAQSVASRLQCLHLGSKPDQFRLQSAKQGLVRRRRHLRTGLGRSRLQQANQGKTDLEREDHHDSKHGFFPAGCAEIHQIEAAGFA